MRALIIVVLAVLVVSGGVLAWRAQSAPAEQHKLYVMVPQGIFLSFNEMMDRYTEKHPNVEFKTMIDTPEAMAEAVEKNPLKPDIFISPGGHEVEVLRGKGYIDPGSEVAFGSYRLAIVVPKANPGKVKALGDLLNPEVKTITISNPDLNAACYAARMSLRNIGLWDKLQKAGKLKVTGCCMSSFKWILDGKAEANVQFLGCPMDEKAAVAEGSKVSFACQFPLDSYYTPRNVAGILKSSKQKEVARDFLKFMTAPEQVKVMLQKRMRDDAKLKDKVGPWGPAQEANPRTERVAA